MLKDENLSVEEFFESYTKEEILDYIEELYNRGDSLVMQRINFSNYNKAK
jgi:hypothetical protein